MLDGACVAARCAQSRKGLAAGKSLLSAELRGCNCCRAARLVVGACAIATRPLALPPTLQQPPSSSQNPAKGAVASSSAACTACRRCGVPAWAVTGVPRLAAKAASPGGPLCRCFPAATPRCSRQPCTLLAGSGRAGYSHMPCPAAASTLGRPSIPLCVTIALCHLLNDSAPAVPARPDAVHPCCSDARILPAQRRLYRRLCPAPCTTTTHPPNPLPPSWHCSPPSSRADQDPARAPPCPAPPAWSFAHPGSLPLFVLAHPPCQKQLAAEKGGNAAARDCAARGAQAGGVPGRWFAGRCESRAARGMLYGLTGT